MSFRYNKTPVANCGGLKPGDHIRVIRGSSSSNAHGLYDHHMLVVSVDSLGNQVNVIHYTQRGGEGMGSAASFSSFGEGDRQATIIEEMIEVGDDDKIELLSYPDDVDCFNAEESIERARSKIGEMSYSLFQNNCECFVNWAVTGKAVSNQAEAAPLHAGIGAVFGALGGYFGRGGSWTEAAKGAVSGAQQGYLSYRQKRL